MCECGCTMNDQKYTLPGPGEAFYIVTLAGECQDCDVPPGITIELIAPGDFMHDPQHRREFTDGPLKLEKWSDSKGVAFITGMRQHEFIKAMKSHLVGLDSSEYGDDGTLDEIAAETILEEMYGDSQVRPEIVGKRKPKKSRP